MGTSWRLWSTIYLGVLFSIVHGCDIQGVTNAWLDLTVTDTDSGIFFQAPTENIGGITGATHSGDVLNFGPYFEATHANNQFTLSLHDNFASYERFETLQSFSVSVTFSCTNGNAARTIIFIVSVIDTNNNDPIFTPTNEFLYTVTPPLSPGYQITGCNSDINVEDIDLTTQRIDFNVENGNGLFEIVYDPDSSTAKNFRGILRTTNFLLSIPEPLTLTISATDVDFTGDPQRTTYTTIRIESNGEFQLPVEPVFSQAYYLATYSEEHLLSHEPISLVQGYSADVTFNLTGDYSQYFVLEEQNNVVTLSVSSQLPTDVLMGVRQLYLVLIVESYLTSGAFTTVVVQLPEVQPIQFEQQLYEGSIVDNELSVPTLVLSQGYDNGYNISITGENGSNFAFTTQGNAITITMTPLADNILEANNVITLQVIAVTDSSTTTTVVALNIVKNDTVTPLFENNLYSGSYSPTTGLVLQVIVLSQGYDETVSFNLEGEHENVFTISQNSNALNLQASTTVPQEIIDEGRDIILTLSASKPRTVGANTAIHIALPRARTLGFEQPTYLGQIQNNELTLGIIILNVGYGGDVTYNVTGEYSEFFMVTNTGSEVTLQLPTLIPENVILENNHLILILIAGGINAVSASTSIVLEIIKQDTSTPVFSQNIYEGSYAPSDGLGIGSIILSQGYDESVSFRLDGEHSQYFNHTSNGNSVILSLLSVPEEVVYAEKMLIFNIIADKLLTVGGSAAVAVRFPTEYTEPAVLAFSKNAYVGTLDATADQLSLNLEDLVLSSGYSVDTQFEIDQEYVSYFTMATNNNILVISLSNPLPPELIQSNNFVLFQITARRERAVTVSASVILEIVFADEILPVFSEPFYSGSYTIEGGLEFTDSLYLAEGYDDLVMFRLDDDVSNWFSLQQNDNNMSLVLSSPIPEYIVFGNRQLLFSIAAYKGNYIARSAIFIDLLDESPTRAIAFANNSYIGSIENGSLNISPITLLEHYEDAQIRILGEYEEFFNIIQNGDTITLELTSQLPDEVITMQPFLVFDIEATIDAVAAYTTVVLEIVQEVAPARTPVFSQPYYSGDYSAEQGLLFEDVISLIQGYTEDVDFTLDGDDAQWFFLTQTGNSVTLSIGQTGIPTSDRNHLLFSIAANIPGSLSGHAAIAISLTDSAPTAIIGFESTSHIGRIENGMLQLGSITLIGNYEGANLSIVGEFNNYFNIIQNGGTITLELTSQLPDEVMLVQPFIVFDIEATIDAASAFTTVVLEVVPEVAPTPTPVFSRPYYRGNYSAEQGLLFEDVISLTHGYSEDVEFTLDGDDAQWFIITQTDNSVTLSVGQTAIPTYDRNNLLFSIAANIPGALSGHAAITISLTDSVTAAIIGFESPSHIGRIENGLLQLGSITLTGYYEGANLSIVGEFNNYFNILQNGDTVTLELTSQLPDEVMLVQPFIVFDIEATIDAASAYTTVVLEIVPEMAPAPTPVFSQPFYSGNYSAEQGLLFEDIISLIQGYSDDVQFTLDGDDAQWFVLTQTGNSVTLSVGQTAIPTSNRKRLLFSIAANIPGALSGHAAISISLTDLVTTASIGFESTSHIGRIENETLQLGSITLTGNYDGANLSIVGEFNNYFDILQNGDTISLELTSQLPDEVMLVQPFIVFDIAATIDAASAYTTVVLEIVPEVAPAPTPVFSQPYYSGSFSDEQGLLFESSISLIQGYSDEVQFSLDGDDSQWFSLSQTGNSVTLSLSEIEIPASDRNLLLFSILASRAGTLSGSAAITITITDTLSNATIQFESRNYVGRIENGLLQLSQITLAGDYEEANFSVIGDFNNYFDIIQTGETITLELSSQLPDEVMLVQPFIVFDIEATINAASAFTTVVLEIVPEVAPAPTLVFSQPYYSGDYSSEHGLLFEGAISLIQGYSENVQFNLVGDDAQWFVLTQNGNSGTLSVNETEIPADRSYLLFSVMASRTNSISGSAAIIISLTGAESQSENVAFDRPLYRGSLNGVLQHEAITIVGYNGTEVQVSGEYEELFSAEANSGVVVVQTVGSVTFPIDVLYIGLELSAEGAHSALLVDINHTEPSIPPTVVFESPYYEVTIDGLQTGLVGRVQATASNGEQIVYSLDIDNAHLQERLSINSDGELQLFSYADTGVYNFMVTATAAISQTFATTTVMMTVAFVAVCENDNYVVPPLIVINRDEEENHLNLVVLNTTEYPGCRYEMTNRWPLNQTWMYVNDAGLHTTAIDREDESIAFMALSQIQVELLLICETDPSKTNRAKREARPDWLGPYDYGHNEWILTESIPYDSRRSLVNLIVNDINDNPPVFENKENEPIAVGYPVPDLVQIVTPRSLIHLKATDRDVGINAELVYWSLSTQLAVGPSTGTVHVGDNQREIAEGTVLTVHATDRAGEGLTGDIDLEIRLLDEHHIAVLTIRDAFEEDEASILGNLTNALGYEVKSLTSVVISDEYDDFEFNSNTRIKRQAVQARGASLRMYVYGLIQREPVDVGQLTNDINSNVIVAVAIADTVSLQDYLASLELCELATGRDTGLLVATIVLSVILFILIVVIGIWFFLKWRTGINYQEFSTANSIESRKNSTASSVKDEPTNTRPRLNIEEIKRSERRLREMLDAPIEEDIEQPTLAPDTKVEIPVSTAPIVIQSIDKLKDANDESDDDEFGERKDRRRKKSVVTFNENVEKIIHVEDNPNSVDGDIEIYKL